jgi:hypothetical protein
MFCFELTIRGALLHWHTCSGDLVDDLSLGALAARHALFGAERIGVSTGWRAGGTTSGENLAFNGTVDSQCTSHGEEGSHCNNG